MKFVMRYLSVLLAVILASACSKKEPNPNPSVLSVTPASCAKESGVSHSITFRVTCDKAFKASVDAAWASVTGQTEGNNNVTSVTVTLQPNEGDDSRTCKITFASGNKTAEASITQLSAKELVSFSEIELLEMFPVSVTIKLPESWTLRCLDEDGSEASWYSANVASGIKNSPKTVQFVASSLNAGDSVRKGKVEISVGGIDIYIPVTQAVTEMLGADLGVFNYDRAGSEIKYDPLRHQVAVLRGAASDSFRIVDPSGNRFIMLEGLPKTYVNGESVSFEFVQNWTPKLDFTEMITAVVTRQDDEFVWLLDGDVSYVVKK